MARVLEERAGSQADATRRLKGRISLAVKLAITLFAFVFIFSRQPLAELWAAVRSISLVAILASVALQLLALLIGTIRWRMLMVAYGASAIPSFAQLFKVYFVGFFYNIYLPGAVGGDLLRGIVTRRAFGDAGTTSAMAVVLVERALGLAGMLALTALSVALFAGDRFENLVPYSVLGIVGIGVAVISLALGRRLARFVPDPARRILGSLPTLAGYSSFAGASLLSLGTHAVVALIGHLLVSSMRPETPLSTSFVAMPLAAAAGFFPGTVAGAGARDLAIIALYETLGVPRAVGAATALAMLFSLLLAAGMGGIVQLLAPLDTGEGTVQPPAD